MGELGTMVGVVIGLAIWIALACWVGALAEDRGQPPGPWFVVALFLPIISLLLVLVLFPRPAVPPAMPTADDAVAASTVARALAATSHLSVHQLVERTGLPEGEVLSQLRALQHLARATRDDTGRWDLTPA